MLKINHTYHGHALDILKTLPDKCVDCCITSPPYWQLRDYKTEHQIWDGDENCQHEFGNEKIKHLRGFSSTATVGNNLKDFEGFQTKMSNGAFCIHCNAWKGELGQEPTIKLYIAHLMLIFNEVYRVLKDTGTCWVNLGDSYNSKSGGMKDGNFGPKATSGIKNEIYEQQTDQLLKSKCLCNIPSRFRIAMTDEGGWILRNNIIWHKMNSMPSSATDRFTVDFEDILFFVKQQKYYFEQQFEAYTEPMDRWGGEKLKPNGESAWDEGTGQSAYRDRNMRPNSNGRNMRTVWNVPTSASSSKHFAMYPEKLLVRMIEAGCPKEICNKCGKAREKIYENQEYIGNEKLVTGKYQNSDVHSAGSREHYLSVQRKYEVNQKAVAQHIKNMITDKSILDKEFGNTTWTHWIRTDDSGASLPSPEQYKKLKELLNLGDDFDREMLTTVKKLVDDKGSKKKFEKYSDCGCNAGFHPGIILDPFSGAGTTGITARKLGRNYINIELNPDYKEISDDRHETTIGGLFN